MSLIYLNRAVRLWVRAGYAASNLLIAELIKGAMTEEGVNVMKDLPDVVPLLAGWHLIVWVWEGGQECWAK